MPPQQKGPAYATRRPRLVPYYHERPLLRCGS